MRAGISVNIFGTTYLLSLSSFPTPLEWVMGFSSRIKGTPFHILFLDYDMIRYDILIEELIYLQNAFELGNFYIFRTRSIGERQEIEVGAYHVINLEIRTLSSIMAILYQSSCDKAFNLAPSKIPERHWTLRIGEKGNRPPPEFIEILRSTYEGVNDAIQSSGHAMLIDGTYKTDITATLPNPDNGETVEVEMYKTAKRLVI